MNRFLMTLRSLWIFLLIGLPLLAQAAPSAPTLLQGGTGLYPRMVRLTADPRHLLAAVAVPPDGDQPGLSLVYESLDGGATWSKNPVGTVADPQTRRGLCCIALFEVPRDLGNLKAGTLLWAGSVGQQDRTTRGMALRIWKSRDMGRTWTYLSDCAHTNSQQGLWEPEFSVAGDGSLICHYSDETDPQHHSQFLAETLSRDGGQTWSQPRPTVALTEPDLRPGMPTVRRLPSGRYAMTYEICNWPDAPCPAFIRFSPDGLHWGDPADPGERILSNTGHSFAHTPVLEWLPGGGPDGTLLLSGQLLIVDPGLVPLPQTGRTLMMNTTGGAGNWLEIPAPFALENVYDNYCPNYSSPLLGSPDGQRVLELASNYDGPLCKPYFGSGLVPSRYQVSHTTRGNGNFQLEYGGTWKVDQTSHFTADPGASVRLRFAGSGVQVTLPGTAQVSLDGGPPRRVSGTYQVDNLKPGVHTLTLRPERGNTLRLLGVDIELGR